MDERALRNEVEQDLRLAATGKVVYLEGVEDVAALIGLLGRTPPSDVPDEGYDVDGVWIRGLPASRRGRGSGSTAVQERVRIAGKLGYRGVRGVVDGDGLAVDDLPEAGDAPISGALQRWPTYCIENLLVQVGWPPEFGPVPSWRAVLAGYVPYAALGRVVRWLHAHLYARGVAGFREPNRSEPLATLDGVRERLRQDEGGARRIRDLVAFFDEEVARCDAALAEDDLARAHALINGKWVVVDHAPRSSGLGADDCRRAWARHAGATGGHLVVRGWWRRIVAL